MKRPIFFIAFVFCFLVSKAQLPITQSIGSPTTLVQVPANGGLRAGIINRTFTDTTSANLTYLDSYQGCQIFTTTDSLFWIRDVGATKWRQLYIVSTPGGGGGSPIDTVMWRVSGTGQTVVNSLSGGGLGTANIVPLWLITSGAIRIQIPAGGITRQTAARYKTMLYDTIDHNLGYGDGGSGSTPTWQQTLTAGSTLTGNNTIDISGNDFILQNGIITISGSDDPLVIRNTNNDIDINVSNGRQITLTSGVPNTNYSKLWIEPGIIDNETDGTFNTAFSRAYFIGNTNTTTFKIIDSSNIIYTQNASVGIGTSTPAKLLHTVGTVRMASLGTASSDTTTNKPLGINSSGDVIPMTYWPGGGSSGLTIGTTTIANSVSGSVLYDSSGILSRNDEFYWDRSNKRLGIGTNGPGYKLDVQNTAGQVDFNLLGQYSSGLRLTSSGGSLSYNVLGGGTSFFYNANNSIRFGTTITIMNDAGIDVDFSVKGDVDANLFYTDASTDRVGIGTSTPSARLHVISTTEQFRAGYDASNYASFTVNSTGNLTVGLTGTTPKTTFSQAVKVPDDPFDASGWNGNVEVPTKNAIRDAFVAFLGTGTYQPVASNFTNVSDTTLYSCQYSWVVDPASGLKVVTVSGKIDITSTAGGSTEVYIDVPVTTSFVTEQEAGGTGSDGNSVTALIKAVTSQSKVRITFNTASGASFTIPFHFTYKVTPP